MFDYAEETLESLIQMAGGFKRGATPSRIEIARRIKIVMLILSLLKRQKYYVSVLKSEIADLLLYFNHLILCLSEAQRLYGPAEVKVEGEVLYPGIYTITRKDERISDVIKSWRDCTFFC